MSSKPRAFLFDLVIYLAVMFLVREVVIQRIGFIANGLLWSFTTLAVAGWRMRARGVSWKDLGLCRPKRPSIAAIATAAILAAAIVSIVAFQILSEAFAFGLAPDTSEENAASKFGDLQGNWLLFLTIIPFVWLQSALEEMLDRGFLIYWIERTLSGNLVATIVAVLAQAAIFGFRHSYDLSERSVTVGLIGLAMGIGYVVFGRNLWAPIVAHCVLNTTSMLDRVT